MSLLGSSENELWNKTSQFIWAELSARITHHHHHYHGWNRIGARHWNKSISEYLNVDLLWREMKFSRSEARRLASTQIAWIGSRMIRLRIRLLTSSSACLLVWLPKREVGVELEEQEAANSLLDESKTNKSILGRCWSGVDWSRVRSRANYSSMVTSDLLEWKETLKQELEIERLDASSPGSPG